MNPALRPIRRVIGQPRLAPPMLVATLTGAFLAVILLSASWLLTLGVAFAQTPTPVPPGTGTISGFVFHDVNLNGTHDEGDLGLERFVGLFQNGGFVQEAEGQADGSYIFRDIPPGDYTVITEFDGEISFCTDPVFPNFDPLFFGGCSGPISQPWHATTPEEGTITVVPGGVASFDFGGVPFDQSVLIGRAILEGDYAPVGTLIEAFANGQSCGVATVEPPGSFNFPTFQIVVKGAGEQPGCATPGGELGFRVGGVDSVETPAYTPQLDQTFPSRFEQHLVAARDTAWYWMLRSAKGFPPAGSTVRAMVGQVVCGESALDVALGAAGFRRLIVPGSLGPDECRQPGAVVSFLLDGVAAETTIDWQPGLRRIDLSLPISQPSPSPAPIQAIPTPTQPSESPSRLPLTGGRPSMGTEDGKEVMAGASAFLLLVIIAILATGPRRRHLP